jgi:hypothetical protein
VKIPELRTAEHTLVVKHDDPLCLRPSHCVIDEDGHTVGIFFGRHAKSIASFCTTFTDAMKLAMKAQGLSVETSESVTAETEPSGRGTEEVKP